MKINAEGLHEIANVSNEYAIADVVFVHGLAGGSHSTWRNENGFFWPSILGNLHPECRIWSAGYNAGMSHWFGAAGMPLQDQAQNLQLRLLARDLGRLPIVFIVHSMGGLLVKELIVRSQVRDRPEAKSLVAAIRGIVFCGTPHRGAGMASAAKTLSTFFRTQIHLQQMEQGGALLDTLHDDFLQWQKTSGCQVQSFVEKEGLYRRRWWWTAVSLGQAVPQQSGNPNIVGCPCDPIPADHIQLVKPANRESDVFAGTDRFLKKILGSVKAEPPETERTLKTISDNIDEILSHYKRLPDRFPAIEELEVTMTIANGGDCTFATRTVFHGTSNRPQQFLGHLITTTEPVAIQDTRFECRIVSPNHRIAFLPTGLRSKRLSVLMMFLPAVRDGDGSVELFHTHFLRNAFADLFDPKKQDDVYKHIVRSSQPVGRVKFRIRIAKECGRGLRFVPVGQSPGAEKIDERDDTDPVYLSYTWLAEQVPDQSEIEIRLKWA
jgi:pimeloyl-ACP methyl ester carboxylesterase